MRRVVCAYGGLIVLSVPKEWTKGFDPHHSFAKGPDGEGYIKFPNGRVFKVFMESYAHIEGPLEGAVREISKEKIEKISWGPMCYPWESGNSPFGHSGNPFRVGRDVDDEKEGIDPHIP